jgi:cell division protein FtsI/penicillin-binding protein 2
MIRQASTAYSENLRLRSMAIVWMIIAILFIARLFFLQVIRHDALSKEAAGVRDFTQVLKAKRGEIFVRDVRTGQNQTFPVALNRDRLLLISDNRKIEDPLHVTAVLAEVLHLPDEEKTALLEKLSQKTRAYQPLEKDLAPEVLDGLLQRIKDERVSGLYIDRVPARFYPEATLFGQVVGFVGRDSQNEPLGLYGTEGFFEKTLKGQDGYVHTEKDPFGGWIPVANRDLKNAHDGDDIILTIDRTIQLKLCTALSEGIIKYHAKSGSGIIMDPNTGAILALCNAPTFDPNEFQKAADASVYNNNAIFRAFEPGSVFKAFTMSSALDMGVVTPTTSYTDKGNVVRDKFTIRNAANKTWGTQTMADVIRESINTGTIFAAEKMGMAKFRSYMEAFHLGQQTGITLKVESRGNIKNLYKPGTANLATASFGQVITTTPLQLIQGYAALAHEGVLLKPQVVYAIRHYDGTIDVQPQDTGTRVVSAAAAHQITEMMLAVVDVGHGKLARVPGYSIVGKTGTAQIAGSNGKYLGDLINNHTFIGYGPKDHPAFVMLITYEAPEAKYAESTAVPTFGQVAPFLLQYLGVPPDRPTT